LLPSQRDLRSVRWLTLSLLSQSPCNSKDTHTHPNPPSFSAVNVFPVSTFQRVLCHVQPGPSALLPKQRQRQWPQHLLLNTTCLVHPPDRPCLGFIPACPTFRLIVLPPCGPALTGPPRCWPHGLLGLGRPCDISLGRCDCSCSSIECRRWRVSLLLRRPPDLIPSQETVLQRHRLLLLLVVGGDVSSF